MPPAPPPPPVAQSVAFQIDAAHTGRVAFNATLLFPPSSTWSTVVDATASYPLIAGGKVFVTTAVGSLYALHLATGAVAWRPVPVGGTYNWAAQAYDNGKVFVVNFDGRLRSFDAATGAPGWSVQLPGQYAFTSPPTALNGMVYTGGAGSGGTLYAVDQTSGTVVWSTGVANGDHSSPAVSSDGVFVAYPCQVYKFGLLAGQQLWNRQNGCGGGGGRTAVFANGRLYVRDPVTVPSAQVHDAATGNVVGSFAATAMPAVTAQYVFALEIGTLRALDIATQAVLWSFVGDGHLVFAPVVIDQVVIAGSGSGIIYALDAATGTPLWTNSAGSGLATPDESNVAILVGFGAGESHLVVPAGNRVTAWKIAP